VKELMLLLVLAAAGCWAIRTDQYEAAGIASRVTWSPGGAFTGESTPAQTAAWWGGIAGVATAVAAFF